MFQDYSHYLLNIVIINVTINVTRYNWTCWFCWGSNKHSSYSKQAAKSTDKPAVTAVNSDKCSYRKDNQIISHIPRKYELARHISAALFFVSLACSGLWWSLPLHAKNYDALCLSVHSKSIYKGFHLLNTIITERRPQASRWGEGNCHL